MSFKFEPAREIPVNGHRKIRNFVRGSNGDEKRFFEMFKDGDTLKVIDVNGGSLICGERKKTLYILATMRNVFHEGARK